MKYIHTYAIAPMPLKSTQNLHQLIFTTFSPRRLRNWTLRLVRVNKLTRSTNTYTGTVFEVQAQIAAFMWYMYIYMLVLRECRAVTTFICTQFILNSRLAITGPLASRAFWAWQLQLCLLSNQSVRSVHNLQTYIFYVHHAHVWHDSHI